VWNVGRVQSRHSSKLKYAAILLFTKNIVTTVNTAIMKYTENSHRYREELLVLNMMIPSGKRKKQLRISPEESIRARFSTIGELDPPHAKRLELADTRKQKIINLINI